MEQSPLIWKEGWKEGRKERVQQRCYLRFMLLPLLCLLPRLFEALHTVGKGHSTEHDLGELGRVGVGPMGVEDYQLPVSSRPWSEMKDVVPSIFPRCVPLKNTPTPTHKG